jgi:hypothetical protein
LRLLVDTQIFLLGYARSFPPASDVLQLLRNRREEFTLLFSEELIDQIRRVGRRVGGKDWAGLILSRIWQDFAVEMIHVPPDPLETVKELGFVMPAEDVAVFLTAWLGNAQMMVSENREFVREAAAAQSLFSCLSAEEFLALYRK